MLDAEDKDLHADMAAAAERLNRHIANETERVRAGLKTDMQRSMDGEEVKD